MYETNNNNTRLTPMGIDLVAKKYSEPSQTSKLDLIICDKCFIIFQRKILF